MDAEQLITRSKNIKVLLRIEQHKALYNGNSLLPLFCTP